MLLNAQRIKMDHSNWLPDHAVPIMAARLKNSYAYTDPWLQVAITIRHGKGSCLCIRCHNCMRAFICKALHCNLCEKSFSRFRRHHCRHCGHIYCGQCLRIISKNIFVTILCDMLSKPIPIYRLMSHSLQQIAQVTKHIFQSQASAQKSGTSTPNSRSKCLHYV